MCVLGVPIQTLHLHLVCLAPPSGLPNLITAKLLWSYSQVPSCQDPAPLMLGYSLPSRLVTHCLLSGAPASTNLTTIPKGTIRSQNKFLTACFEARRSLGNCW